MNLTDVKKRTQPYTQASFIFKAFCKSPPADCFFLLNIMLYLVQVLAIPFSLGISNERFYVPFHESQTCPSMPVISTNDPLATVI